MTTNRERELVDELEAAKASRALACDTLEQKVRECRVLEERLATLDGEMRRAVSVFDTDRAKLVNERDEARRYARAVEDDLDGARETIEWLHNIARRLADVLCEQAERVDEARALLDGPSPSNEHVVELDDAPSAADDDESDTSSSETETE